MDKKQERQSSITLDDLIESTLLGVQRATDARRLAGEDLKGFDLAELIRNGGITVGIIMYPEFPRPSEGQPGGRQAAGS